MKYVLLIILFGLGQTLSFGPFSKEECFTARKVVMNQIHTENLVFCVPISTGMGTEASDDL